MQSKILEAKAEALEDFARALEAEIKMESGTFRQAAWRAEAAAEAFRTQATNYRASEGEKADATSAFIGSLLAGEHTYDAVDAAKEAARGATRLMQAEAKPDYWQTAWRMADTLAKHLAVRPADYATSPTPVQGWKWLPEDFLTHMGDWETAVGLAMTMGDPDGYWAHQLKTLNNIKAMLAASPPAPSAQGWIPVGERLPEDGLQVLVIYKGRVELASHYAKRQCYNDVIGTVECGCGAGWKYAKGCPDSEHITFWMPIDPAP